MKTVLCALTLLTPLSVGAETITLQPETCFAVNLCFTVPNNAGVSVDYISNATQYGRLVIEIDGDIYDSGLWARPDLSNFLIYDGAGNPLSGSISMTTVATGPCIRSGRATSCPRQTTLNGGTLTR